MMKRNSEIKIDVEKLAHLAKISISEKEILILEKEMNEILNFASQLSQICDAEIKNNIDMQTLKNVIRDDVPLNEYSREELLLNSKQKNDEYFCIPQIID